MWRLCASICSRRFSSGAGAQLVLLERCQNECPANRRYQVCWIYISEIPTARLRGLNVALGAATQWLFNLVIARSVPNMLVTMGEGGYGAFILFSCFAFCMFVFVWVRLSASDCTIPSILHTPLMITFADILAVLHPRDEGECGSCSELRAFVLVLYTRLLTTAIGHVARKNG